MYVSNRTPHGTVGLEYDDDFCCGIGVGTAGEDREREKTEQQTSHHDPPRRVIVT
jgi:hypothetical protein